MSTMVWSHPRCPGCFRICPVGVMSLAATCECGMFWADTVADKGWYYSVDSYRRGDQPFTKEEG